MLQQKKDSDDFLSVYAFFETEYTAKKEALKYDPDGKSIALGILIEACARFLGVSTKTLSVDRCMTELKSFAPESKDATEQAVAQYSKEQRNSFLNFLEHAFIKNARNPRVHYAGILEESKMRNLGSLIAQAQAYPGSSLSSVYQLSALVYEYQISKAAPAKGVPRTWIDSVSEKKSTSEQTDPDIPSEFNLFTSFSITPRPRSYLSRFESSTGQDVDDLMHFNEKTKAIFIAEIKIRNDFEQRKNRSFLSKDELETISTLINDIDLHEKAIASGFFSQLVRLFYVQSVNIYSPWLPSVKNFIDNMVSQRSFASLGHSLL